MADSGPGHSASDRSNESDDDCPKGQKQQQCTCELTCLKRAHRRSEAMHFERENLERIKRALEGESWFDSAAADDQFSGSRREKSERVWRNGRGLAACDSVGIVLLALVAIISIELAFASVSLVAKAEHVNQSNQHQAPPLTPPPSSAINRTSACDKQRRQVSDGGARCNQATTEPSTNLQSAPSREISRTSQDNNNNDHDNGPIEERSNQRGKRSNYHSTTAALAHDNNNNGSRRVCNDCLAIPLVALVGGRQINGFILQPTPANLQARLSSKRATAGASKQLANSDYEQHQQQQSSRRVRSNVAHGNHQQHRLQTNEPIGISFALGDSSRHGISPTVAYDKRLHSKNYPEIHYQPPKPRPTTTNLFEPKSDDKCPMVGHVTVCDQINFYPAEAILHRLNNLERALYKSHFNIDSLFSDESVNLSDPFETPVVKRMGQVADDLMGSNESNYAKRAKTNSETYLAYGRDSPDGSVKSPEVSVEKKLHATREENSGDQEGNEGNFTRSHSLDSRFESNSNTFSRMDTRQTNSQVSHLGGGPSRGSQFHESLARGESITSPTSDWGHELTTVNNWPELKQRPKHAAPYDKMLGPAEQKGEIIGGTNSIHNVQPTKLSIERPAPRVSGAHKVGARVKGGRKSGGETESKVAARNGPSRHELKLATAATPETMTTTLASESSVKIGGHQLGTSATFTSPTTNSVQTHKLSQRLNMGWARTSALGGGAKAVERRPLSSDIAVRRAQPNVGHGSVNDGHGDGALDGQASQREPVPQQASAELDSGPARNNQEQRNPVGDAKSLRQPNGAASDNAGGTQSFGSLSSSSVSLVPRSEGGGGSAAAASKVLTQAGTNSVLAIRSRGGGGGRQLNSLSPKPAKLLLPSALSSVHDPNVGQIEPKFPSTQYQGNLPTPRSNSSQLAGGRFVSKKQTWAGKPNELTGALTKIGATLRTDAGFRVRTTSNGLERPKRQVPDSSSERDNSEAGGQAGSVEQPPPPSPSTSDDSEAPSAVPQPICRARSIYISPRAAMNDKKQWKYVVNAPERDPRIKQIIKVDICAAPFEPCSGDVTIPLGFISQCKQKYAKKKLLALNSQSGLLEVDSFFIPSCCVCQLVPDRPTGAGGGGPMSAMDENS